MTIMSAAVHPLGGHGAVRPVSLFGQLNGIDIGTNSNNALPVAAFQSPHHPGFANIAVHLNAHSFELFGNKP